MSFHSKRTWLSIGAATLFAACSSNTVSNNDGGNPDSGPSTDGGNGDGGLTGDGGSPPGAPVLSFTTSQGGVSLTWTLAGASGDERFTVLRSDQSAPFVKVTGTTQVTADAYLDKISSALPGAAHVYEVTATNGNGTGPASNTIEVLQAPGDVSGGGSDTRVLLHWSAVQNATSYDVYKTAQADGGGTATKIGSATQAEFVDNGSIAPITTGESYGYQVIAKAIDGGQPSTGSNFIAVRALGIDLSNVVTHVSDLDGGVAVPEYPGAAIYALQLDAGTFGVVNQFTTSTAAVFPGIPNQPWHFAYGDITFLTLTSARTLDVGSVQAGRADQTVPTNLPSETTMTYALTALDPWTVIDGGPSDTLQSVSVGAGNFVNGLENALDGDGGITAGAITFAGKESIGGTKTFADQTGDYYLVDSTKGDQYYLTQLHEKTSGAGAHPYRAVTKAYSSTTLHMTDGSDSSIAGAMLAVAPVAVPDLKFNNTAFLAQKAAINPAATNGGQTVTLFAEKDFATYGHYMTPPSLLTASLDGSATGDVDLGAVLYGNPFPASWQTGAQIESTFKVPYHLPGDTKPASFSSVSRSILPIASVDLTSIGPSLQPVTNLQIAGKDAFTDQVNVGASPTISWTAPAGGQAPNDYLVSIYELSLDGTATTIGYILSPELQDLVITTTATSYKIPSAFLTAETAMATHWYFVTVTAVYNKLGATALDLAVSPLRYGDTFLETETVSNKFTTGPGTAPPSSYR
jgi:hypothetical protein